MAGFLWEGVAAVKLEGIIILGKKEGFWAWSKDDPKQERVLPLVFTFSSFCAYARVGSLLKVVRVLTLDFRVPYGWTAVCSGTRRSQDFLASEYFSSSSSYGLLLFTLLRSR